MKKIKTIIFGLGNIGLLQDINKNMRYIHTQSPYLFQKKFDLVGAIDISKKNRQVFLKNIINQYSKIFMISKIKILVSTWL